MTRLDEAVTAAFKVVAYAIHSDDKPEVVEELADALRPFFGDDVPEGMESATLDLSYGLGEGDIVRFPRQGKTRPDTGKVMGLNADGSIQIMCDRTKFARSILPENIERQVIGPRGGVNWEKVKP